MKIVLIVIDGLGDRPVPRLGNKTPLEAAVKPNLNELAKKGICGLVKPFFFAEQKTPRSDSAHLALLGYNPKVWHLGRGPYEAAGIDMKLEKGDVILRANFGTVGENLKIIDRRAERISSTQPLVKAISGITVQGVKFIVKKSLEHRAVLVIRGKNLSEKITDPDIKKLGIRAKKARPANKSKEAKFTADILNIFLEKAHQILQGHPLNRTRREIGFLPANYFFVRGAGKFKDTMSFKQKYGLKSCFVGGGALYRGIAKVLQMDLKNVKGADGSYKTNLKGKFLAVKRNIKKYDFIFCHIKAADTFGENGDYQGKKEFIEKIDKNIKLLFANPKKGISAVLVITADHATCSLMKGHCGLPVPILIYARNVKPDRVSEFSERACRQGKLGLIRQEDLMKKIISIAKRQTI